MNGKEEGRKEEGEEKTAREGENTKEDDPTHG